MTRVDVNTSALRNASIRFGKVTSNSTETASGVRSVARSIDWQISAKSQVYNRLLQLERQVHNQASRSRLHRQYLNDSADRYENLERTLANRRVLHGRPVIASSWDGLVGSLTKPMHTGGGWIAGRWGMARRLLDAMTVVLTATKSVPVGLAKGSLKTISFLSNRRLATYMAGTVKVGNGSAEKVSRLRLLGHQYLGMSNSVAKWASGVSKAVKIASLISAVQEGWQEFQNSSGSTARRVSNGVITGLAHWGGKWAGGYVGGLTGAKIGLAAGLLIAGPVGGVVAMVVLGGVGSWAGSEAGGTVAKTLINLPIAGKSIKTRAGDAVSGLTDGIAQTFSTGARVTGLARAV